MGSLNFPVSNPFLCSFNKKYVFKFGGKLFQGDLA